MGVVKRRLSRSVTEPIRMIAVFAVHLSVFSGWYTAQRIKWPEVVVVIHKFLCYFSDFIQCVKLVSIQNTSPISFVKSFDISILCRFAWKTMCLNVISLAALHFCAILATNSGPLSILMESGLPYLFIRCFNT